MLIHAASGGVGHFAVQIAKHLGAYVVATSSAANRAFVNSLGADYHIDYRATDFEAEIQNVDFCLETQGVRHFERSAHVVRRGGTIINLPSGLGDPARRAAQARDLDVNYFMQVFPSGAHMQDIAQMLAAGTLVTHIDACYPLDETVQAHRHIESGHAVGKVVIDVET